jgi:hypothetical protein
MRLISAVSGVQIPAPPPNLFAPFRKTMAEKQGVINHASTVGGIMRSFKARCTYMINQIRNNPGMPVWQRNYYEHVVRDEEELREIREYIVNNPMQWELDTENPQSRRESKLSNA